MTAPTSVDAAVASLRSSEGQARAGGTDLVALAQLRRASGPFVDLHRLTALGGVAWSEDGSARIGALTTIAGIAGDPKLRAAYPALTATAGALATPQIRAVATIGGNLLQRNRCSYYRNPAFSCYQSGGDSCPAREGDHRHASVIDLGPCVAPHPSSMAMALLAYDAAVHVADGAPVPVRDLYDGADPTRDHCLAPGQLITGIELPPPAKGETAAYHRATSRSHAEWPLVEAVARLTRADGAIAEAAVAVGGVARTPIRLTEVERALTGLPAVPASIPEVLASATTRCSPLPETGYKVRLLRATVQEVLEQSLTEA